MVAKSAAEKGIGQANEIIEFFQKLIEEQDNNAKRMGGELV